ncbi:chromate resistance protein ChrB domain-containing protein [Paraburkholderia sp. RL17-337-BIB-A]|uniref:chromate resistance protein ChrB domain-containing protein n=1 Tax=Paraburkholderia sp. RL17-337-BIB-A TaxID=3031636 RepID=UPI0038B97041
MNEMTDWLLLVLTLPTDNATARMRYWRALKSKGCAVLRDGVYLLPDGESAAGEMGEMCESIGQAGGTSYLMNFRSRDGVQDAEFRSLFDRAEEYATLRRSLDDTRKTLSGLTPAEITKLLRRTRKEFEAIAGIDFFPNEATVRAQSAWQDFVAAADAVLSPGEPHQAEGTINLLKREEYQGRVWATRRRLWVDRVASAWLIRRFVDRDARFEWLASPDDCPPDALGFDFDGAAFTHINDRVTFEVLAASFGIEDEPGMAGLSDMVHSLDVGGVVVPEAAGFEAVMTGATQRGLNDDELLNEMSQMLDSLLAHFAAVEKGAAKRRR